MFSLDKQQEEDLQKWMEGQDLLAAEIQKTRVTEDDPLYHIFKQCWDEGFAYTGAIGGGYTFSFSPTSIGIVVKVSNSFTGQEIDLTDYHSW